MKIIDELYKKLDLLHGERSYIQLIQEYESKLKIKFSSEYRQYLLEFSIVAFNGHELTGISKTKRLNVVDVTLNERNLHENIPNDFYVIESANIDGIVIWQSSTGEIYQTSPNSEPKKICDSLAEYISL